MDFLTKMNNSIKKNILDLNYNKYLQYKITSVIVATTYLFAVSIALVTKQLRLGDYVQMFVVSILSIVVLMPCIYFIIISTKHLKLIIRLVRELD